MVELVVGQVRPHTAIVLAVKCPLLQALLGHGFTQQVGIGFVVELVKSDAYAIVGGVVPCVHPTIHRTPKAAHVGVTGLPGQ